MSLRVASVAWLTMGLAVAGTGLALAGPVSAAESTPSPSASPTGTTWALQPSAVEGPDGRVSLRHVIAGGGEASDLIAVTNFGDRPATFAVYASDGVVTTDGNFDLLPADETPVDGGAWITVSPVEGATARQGGGVVLEVPAAATVVLPVLIDVPANATPGDHPAGIVAELVSGDGGGVQFASRVGVRVHLRVDGDIVAELVPEGVTASYSPSWNPFAPGTVTVRYAVANAGNVRVGAETVASVAGPLGLAPGQVNTEQREVLPGQAATTTVEIPVTPLFFSWGEITTTPVVVGEDEIDAALSGGTASFRLWTVPWSQLALLAVLIGAFFLIRALRARSAARTQAKIDAAVAAATGGVEARPATKGDAPGTDEPQADASGADGTAGPP